MPKLQYHTELMRSTIRASKEIIKCKGIIRRLEWLKSDIEIIRGDTEHVEKASNDLRLRILELKSYISRRMRTVTDPVLFFEYDITHFTQEEMDKGYLVIEYVMSDDPCVFARFAIILKNGKVIPFINKNLPIIEREAEPV